MTRSILAPTGASCPRLPSSRSCRPWPPGRLRQPPPDRRRHPLMRKRGGPRRARPGAIPICRETSPTRASSQRPSNGRASSREDESKMSRARNWPTSCAQRQERVINNARPPDGGVHAPLHWSDRFDITKGSRPWLVVEPADGKIPPMTPEGQQRAAARAAAAAAARRVRGPADSPRTAACMTDASRADCRPP